MHAKANYVELSYPKAHTKMSSQKVPILERGVNQEKTNKKYFKKSTHAQGIFIYWEIRKCQLQTKFLMDNSTNTVLHVMIAVCHFPPSLKL